MWSAVGLAQARSPRSGDRSVLAQTAGSRLGETANRGPGGFTNSHLGESISPERDGFSLKNLVSRLSECSSENPCASLCYSRLGKTSSLGRK